jgi:peptidoglycan hydrolase CwlO-like protein
VSLVTLVASPLSWVVRAGTASGADQLSSLRAEATTVAQQLIHGQLQVEAYQQQVSVAAARVAADGRAIAQLNAEITKDQQQITAKAAQVRELAIRSYTDYGSGSSSVEAALFSGDQEHLQVASEYSSIAVGTITTAMDELHTAQQTFAAHQASLQHQQEEDRAEQAARSDDLAQADATQAQLTALQSRVTGQLAAAVAEQSAAQSAAAAAAVAAAQRSAAKAPATAGTSPGTTGTGGSVTTGSGATTAGAAGAPAPTDNTTDPALNPFLQCVVQAESGGDYQAVSPNGLYLGAFQFAQSTWNTAAQAAGRPDLVGVPPNRASKADQDTVAVALYALDGERPWLGDRCSS